MSKRFLFFLIATAAILTAVAQQSLWGGSKLTSPEINPDNTVTFRLLAPNADSVQLTGDFLPAEAHGKVNLVKDKEGVWTYTTPEPLKPELYSYVFFVDGLRTPDPSNVFLNRDVSTLANIFIIDGGQGHYYKVNDLPHGSVSRVWYDSPTLGKKRRMTIYTPPGYEDSNESYPVFYLLHGAGGDEEAWPALGRATQIMDNLIADGKAEPMIVVMTNGNAVQTAAPGESAEGMVKPTSSVSRMNRGEFEMAFPDVVNYVDKHYRTKADKAHRAIAGLSMGGFHSLHISKQYPDMFDYIGLYSAAIFPPENSTSEIYKDTDGKLATQFAKNPKLYWIAIGDKDFLYNDNVKYRQQLDSKGYPYIYRESPDGHIWKNWRIYLTEFVPQLFK